MCSFLHYRLTPAAEDEVAENMLPAVWLWDAFDAMIMMAWKNGWENSMCSTLERFFPPAFFLSNWLGTKEFTFSLNLFLGGKSFRYSLLLLLSLEIEQSPAGMF